MTCSAPTSAGETAYAADLTRSLRAGMLLLADRNFGCGPLARKIAAAEADFLVRVKDRVRRPWGSPSCSACSTGPGCPSSAASPLRVIDTRLDPHHQRRAARSVQAHHTLTDPARYPASELAVLTMSAGRSRPSTGTEVDHPRRSRPAGPHPRRRRAGGLALLVTYQALRAAIADAASTVPGADPDRASFTIALNAARDQVTLAAGVIVDARVDLAGWIGHLVLASLMPAQAAPDQPPRRQARHL